MDDRRQEIEARMTDGTAVRLRRIRGDDAGRLRDGIAEMSPESRYLRFFSFAHRVPEAVIARLTEADPDCHIGWGAILADGAEPQPIAAAHIVRPICGDAMGELSIAVLDAWHGRGLARLLLSALIADNRAAGVHRVEIVVLGSNSDALALFRHIGAKSAGFDDGTVRLMLELDCGLARLGEARACARVIAAVQAMPPP